MSHLELPAELLDEFVHPDIHSLFQHYSELYSGGELGHCSVEWRSGIITMVVSLGPGPRSRSNVYIGALFVAATVLPVQQ